MTTTPNLNIPSSVPNFLDDDEAEGGVETQPGSVEQPENSSEPQSQPAESATIGAVRTVEAEDFNPVLNGDWYEYDDETEPEPEPEPVPEIPEVPAAPTGKEWKKLVAAGEVKGYEHPSKGKNEDSPTKKKRKGGSTYHRRKLGERDFTVLAVLLIHEFLTTKQVGIIRGIKGPSARRLMLGLQELGVVGQEKFPFGPQLWYLTGQGLTYLEGVIEIPETAQPLHRKGHFDISKIRPNMLAAQVTAQLIAGTDTIRKFLDIPLSTGLDLVPHLIPESYIRSEFSKAIANHGERRGFKSGKTLSETIQSLWSDSRSRLHEGKSTRLEFMEHPELWTVVGRKFDTDNYKANYFHPADLIINLMSVGQPSVYVEIELSKKKDRELRSILMTHFRRQVPSAVGQVVYLTNQNSIAKQVRRIAQDCFDEVEDQANLPTTLHQDQTLVQVGLLKGADGKPISGSVWDL